MGQEVHCSNLDILVAIQLPSSVNKKLVNTLNKKCFESMNNLNMK